MVALQSYRVLNSTLAIFENPLSFPQQNLQLTKSFGRFQRVEQTGLRPWKTGGWFGCLGHRPLPLRPLGFHHQGAWWKPPNKRCMFHTLQRSHLKITWFHRLFAMTLWQFVFVLCWNVWMNLFAYRLMVEELTVCLKNRPRSWLKMPKSRPKNWPSTAPGP